MRVIGVVQARMGSTRLPGKVLLPLGCHSALSWTLRAAAESRVLDDLVVATTTDRADDAIVHECDRLEVACHRGPVEDVLARFMGALSAHPADAVMRFTADCPLLDPAVIRTVARVLRANPRLDYVSTSLPRSLPRGTDAEIITVAALQRIDSVATSHHRTHVTSYAYTHADEFAILGITFPPDSSFLRVTLDTQDDYALLQAVVESLGDRPPPVRELVRWLAAHPEVRALNKNTEQKPLEAG